MKSKKNFKCLSLLMAIICFTSITFNNNVKAECNHTVDGLILDTIHYEGCSSSQHYVKVRCPSCNTDVTVLANHNFTGAYTYQSLTGTTHYEIETCVDCGFSKKTTKTHNFDSNVTYTYSSNTKHKTTKTCLNCNYNAVTYDQHNKTDRSIKQKATYNKAGVEAYTCSLCQSNITNNFTWKKGEANCTKYTVKCSKIYRDTKKVKITFNNAVKGTTVKLKIGSKTYKKKIKNTKKTCTIKISKPKTGQKYTVKLYYKNTLLASTKKAKVKLADKPKEGMTMKDVRAIWGKPDHITYMALGFEYWDYKNGSSVRFRSGIVQRVWNKFF